MGELMQTVGPLAAEARVASRALAAMPSDTKDAVLRSWADALESRATEILAANSVDVTAARTNDISEALIDRLCLDEARIQEMAEGLRLLATLRDPIGTVLDDWTQPNGLRIQKVRVPLGVIGVIYESRPNVTVDAAGLALKSGNAVLLRGSSMAVHSNEVLIRVLQESGAAAGLPAGSVQAVPPTRESAGELMRARGLIDLLIPRGGTELIQRTVSESTVPVIETGIGNCHVYVDAAADLDKALLILMNAKVQRPAVCNAAESFLVHAAVADTFVPRAIEALRASGVTIYGDELIRAYDADRSVEPATDEEYRAEFYDLRISAKVVDSLEDAIAHITEYGTQHTEAIVTEDPAAAQRFVDAIDAAAVMVNASTRFTDGAEFGFGAEVEIGRASCRERVEMMVG